MAKPRKRSVSKPRHKKTKKAKPKKPKVKKPTLADIRKRLGLSQVELADCIGVHKVTVSKWERGALKPSPWQQALYHELAKSEPIGCSDRWEIRGKAKTNPIITLYLLLDRIHGKGIK